MLVTHSISFSLLQSSVLHFSLLGSSSSYRSEETGACVPSDYGTHCGGEDSGEGGGEATSGQVGHPAGQTGGQQECLGQGK